MINDNNNIKPGELALENMQLLHSDSKVFKVPNLPRKKVDLKKHKVLDEDIYIEGISKIIQRDFFPDLERLKAQNDYLEAMENKDYVKLKEIARKYTGQRPPTEPYNSPATFDTPNIDCPPTPSISSMREQRTDNEESAGKRKKLDVTDKYSLDSYLALHTSEDNASYDRLIALEDKKKSSKHASQFEAEISSLAILQAATELPSIENQADQTTKPFEMGTWSYKARNYIMYVPNGAESQGAPIKPELIHANTRLQTNPFKETLKKSSAEKSSETGDGAGAAIESDEAYGLVTEASPAPGALGESPLMTWGRLDGTPFRLDAGDTPAPSSSSGAAYRMLECGTRERIAIQLAEKAARNRRPATPRRPTTPANSFRTNTERLASMSPAARKLATKHLLLTPKLKLTPNNVGVLAYGSTPKRHRTPLVTTPNGNRKSESISAGGSSNGNNNLTDNLLQINVAKRTRLRAFDFFK